MDQPCMTGCSRQELKPMLLTGHGQTQENYRLCGPQRMAPRPYRVTALGWCHDWWTRHHLPKLTWSVSRPIGMLRVEGHSWQCTGCWAPASPKCSLGGTRIGNTSEQRG